MRYAVVGAGAMGSLFGGLLARAGWQVHLLDPWVEQVETLRKEGLVIEDATGALGGGTVVVPVRATTNPADIGTVDVVVFFVKGYHTRQAALDARPLFGDTTVALTLQNGLGNVEELEAVLGRGRVLAGTTSCGATLLAPGRIRFAGLGPTVIGRPSGELGARAQAIADGFRSAGLETSLTDDIRSALWGKVIINVGINALTALTGFRNGQLLDYPETKDLLRAAVSEAAAVAAAKGIRLPWADPAAHVEEVARLTAANRSSMLQDVERGRRTEIDTINGAVVREAEAVGLAAPVNKVLTLLVKAREKAAIGGAGGA